MRNVRLTVDADQPRRPVVEVDGTDIARSLSSYTLTQSAREVPSLTVEVPIPTVEFQGKATVVMSDRCAEALVALGWTPPDAMQDQKDLIEEAWSLLAGAYDGDWRKADQQWRLAAERWQARYAGEPADCGRCQSPGVPRTCAEKGRTDGGCPDCGACPDCVSFAAQCREAATEDEAVADA